MNFKTAAIVGGAAFVLSLLMGLVGGVPLFDIVVRALFWGAFGFGGALGVERLLRMMVPELFSSESADPVERADATISAERPPERVVDIVVEDDGPPRYRADDLPPDTPPTVDDGSEPRAEAVTAEGPASTDEEMPEIGSFLDAFKPGGPEATEASGAGPAPEIGEYAPQSSEPSLARAEEVTIDGEAQDPAILAKAVQTVMKRDGQGT